MASYSFNENLKYSHENVQRVAKTCSATVQETV